MNVKTFAIVAGLVAAFGSSTAFAADEYSLNQNLPSAAVATAPRVAVRVAALDEYQGNQYPAAVVPASLQRAQVVAEAIEARKLGLVADGERFAVPTATQAEQVRLAGLKAINSHVATK